MKNATQTLATARELQTKIRAERGYRLPIRTAWNLIRGGERLADLLEAESDKLHRAERVKRGMVGNWIEALRACGCWDGE